MGEGKGRLGIWRDEHVGDGRCRGGRGDIVGVAMGRIGGDVFERRPGIFRRGAQEVQGAHDVAREAAFVAAVGGGIGGHGRAGAGGRSWGRSRSWIL